MPPRQCEVQDQAPEKEEEAIAPPEFCADRKALGSALDDSDALEKPDFDPGPLAFAIDSSLPFYSVLVDSGSNTCTCSRQLRTQYGYIYGVYWYGIRKTKKFERNGKRLKNSILPISLHFEHCV